MCLEYVNFLLQFRVPQIKRRKERGKEGQMEKEEPKETLGTI